MIRVPALATALLASSLALPAAAVTLRVPSLAFPTIQSAVDAAQAGDVVLVRKGIYAERVVVAGKTRLTLKGSGKPQIDGSRSGIPLTLSGCSAVTVTGFALVNFANAGLLASMCDALAVMKLSVSNGSGDGIRIEGGRDALVSGNLVLDAGLDCISLAGSNPPASADVVKNRVTRCGGNGIDVDGASHQVLKNTITDAQNNGLSLRGTLGLATGNKILNARADGISLGSGASGNTVSANSVSFPGEDGIDVSGGGNTISRNKISGSPDDGIEGLAGPNVYERNKVSASGDDGFDLESNGNTLSFNFVSGGSSGFELTGAQNTLTSNKVSSCLSSGFELTSGSGNLFTSNGASRCQDGFVVRAGAVGNRFVSNKATTSADDDLRDFNVEGANDYDLNRFKTKDVSPAP